MSNTATSISRRLEKSLDSLIDHDYESALVHFFPALDKTAKLRRPKDGVGSRIKKFLDDEEPFITFLAFRIAFKNTRFDGYTFGEIIYKFGRTSVMHEGELDPRLSFGLSSELGIIGDKWALPPSYIAAMITAVMAAPENKGEHFSTDKRLLLNDKKVNANEVWGNKALVEKLINMPQVP